MEETISISGYKSNKCSRSLNILHCFIINTSFLVDDAKSSSSGNNNSDDDDDNGSQRVLDTYCVLITVLKCFHVN